MTTVTRVIEATVEIAVAQKCGFEICEFGEDETSCDGCGQIMRQLFWRSVDIFSQDGEYYCFSCMVKELLRILHETEELEPSVI